VIVDQVKIALDADVVIHLVKANKLQLLHELFKRRLVVLDVVLNELFKNHKTRVEVEGLFRLGFIEEIEFPKKWMGELLQIDKKAIGLGEKATLIYCKNEKNIIASSNTRDILDYCKTKNISYISTLDIFVIAIRKGKLTREEANKLIKVITKNNGSYLCCKTIEEHERLHFDVEKVNY